jgi:hypothetical protein
MEFKYQDCDNDFNNEYEGIIADLHRFNHSIIRTYIHIIVIKIIESYIWNVFIPNNKFFDALYNDYDRIREIMEIWS